MTSCRTNLRSGSYPVGLQVLERNVQIGKDIDPLIKNEIIKLLGQYKDVFASNPLKMSGIAHEVMEYKLNED